jgi:predicted phage terminase large subunit-like protein
MLIDLWREQCTPDVSASALIDLNSRYSPRACIVENDNASRVWSRLVFEQAQRNGRRPPPIQLEKIGGRDKLARSASLRAYVMNDRFLLLNRSFVAEVIDELANFGAGADHDDIVDAIAVGCSVIHRIPNRTKPAIEELDRRRWVVGGPEWTLDNLWAEQDETRSRWTAGRI